MNRQMLDEEADIHARDCIFKPLGDASARKDRGPHVEQSADAPSPAKIKRYEFLDVKRSNLELVA